MIDLMKSIQNNPSFKLESYSLDNVSSTFMRGSVSETKQLDNANAEGMRIFTKSSKGLLDGGYVTFVAFDGIIENPHADGQKFMITHVTPTSFDVLSNIDFCNDHKYEWCENKDDISVKQIFSCVRGSAADRAVVAKYCVQDCVLVSRLFDKLDVLTNNLAMANVCCVPFSYLFLRGQGVKVLSLVSRQTRKDKYLLPVIRKKIVDDDGEESEQALEGFEGALVLQPQADIHYEPVAVSDFASLYPSSMIAMNLSHETFVEDPEYMDLPGVSYETIEYDNYQYLKLGRGDVLTKVLNEAEPVKRSVFVQPQRDEFGKTVEATRGVIPRILQQLLSARKATKKKMAVETDPFRKGLLNALQNAYKVTSNSVSALSPAGLLFFWVSATKRYSMFSDASPGADYTYARHCDLDLFKLWVGPVVAVSSAHPCMLLFH